jgi:hypothetical protein
MTIRALVMCAAAQLCACSKADSKQVEPAAPPAVESAMTPAVAPAATGSGLAHPQGAAMQPTLAVKLLASPTQLTLAERDKFMVGIEVTNRGKVTVDPQMSTGELTANGERSMAWSLAINNGLREPKWSALPPGETIKMSWPLGDALFDKPGAYHLVLSLGDQQATADIRVTK